MNDEDTLLPGVSGAMGGHSAWLQGLKSPLINDEEDSGSKELKLRFDVSEYAPEEIMVKTVDNKLLVNFIVDQYLRNQIQIQPATNTLTS